MYYNQVLLDPSLVDSIDVEQRSRIQRADYKLHLDFKLCRGWVP